MGTIVDEIMHEVLKASAKEVVQGMEIKPRVLLLNTTVVPLAAGEKAVIEITPVRDPSRFERFIQEETEVGYEVVSFVGHQATADVMAEDIGRPVEVNWEPAEMNVGDVAICLKMNGRPAPGVELTRAEMEKIGYNYSIMIRVD